MHAAEQRNESAAGAAPSGSSATGEAEGKGASVGEAKWAAMKELERRYPGVTVEQVDFEVIEESPADGGGVRVRAQVNLSAWRRAERVFEWPDEPIERVRELLRRITAHLG